MTGENNITGFKPIVAKELFASKNPGLAKLVPGFVFRYITRILHLDFMNEFLRKNGHLKGIEFVDRAVEDFNIKEIPHNLENIPEMIVSLNNLGK